MTREEFQKRRMALNPSYKPKDSSGTESLEEVKINVCELKKRANRLKDESDSLFLRIESHATEEERVVKVLHNAPAILNDLQKIFEESTSLKYSDWPFVLLATGLQLLRIYMLPKIMEKYEDENRIEHDDPDMKEMIDEERREYSKKHQNWESKGSEKYRSWQQILYEKVPYDATAGSPAEDVNMHGGLHRVKTLGHDPVLGWIFGVCNIISDSITICPEYKLGEKKLRIPFIRTHAVQMKGSFKWKEQIPTYKIFSDSLDSIREDKHRLYAAIFAQGLHLTSDKYSKLGLPIPFLSLIDSDKAYEIYKNGYDYLDFKYDFQIPLRAAKSAMAAILINKIIASIHTFFYNPEEEPNQNLYAVRTRKIVLYSDLIATSSNVIQTAIRSYCGDNSAIKNIDLGGLVVTIHRLFSDITFIQNIKEEFLMSEWSKVFYGTTDKIDLNNY